MMQCEMTLHARKLKNAAGLLKNAASLLISDPFAVVTHVGTGDEKGKCLGRTEEAHNNLSPDWQYVFRFTYLMGRPMKLCVQIFDKVKKDDYKCMGSAIFDVGEVLGSPAAAEAKRLKRGGIIIARLRKGTSSGELRLKLKGYHLINVDGFMKKSDPFFELHRRTEDEEGFITWEKVYTSKVILDNLNPCWPELVMDLGTICDGDLNLQIKLIIYDYEPKRKNDPMGEILTTVNQLIDVCTSGKEDASQGLVLKLKGKPTGKIIVLEAHVSGVSDSYVEMAGVKVKSGGPSKIKESGKGGANFIDYCLGGCEFNTIVAIDFTGSNGHPDLHDSYHFLSHDKSKTNDYEKSIIALLGILGKFDADKHYLVLGFGAKYNGILHNVFQCGKTKLVAGVNGVLKAYREQFQSGITMANTPTVFTNVIKTATATALKAAEAAESIDQQAYTILLILTDGDMGPDSAELRAVIEEATRAPLSIIFVGIGDATFEGFGFIDEGRATMTGREVCQFANFNNLYSSHGMTFTFEALSEIPNQLVKYFQGKGIDPLPEIPFDLEAMIRRANDKPEAPPYEIVYSFNADEVPKIVSGGELNISLFAQFHHHANGDASAH